MNMYSGTVDRGAETFVHELAQRLSENHDVTLFQQGPKKGYEKYSVVRKYIEIDWSKSRIDNSFWGRFFVLYFHRKIAVFTLKSLRKIWKDKYDIVIPVNGGWQPAFIRIITWLYRGKMVIAGQSGIGWDDRNNIWSFPNYFIAKTSKAKRWAKKANPFLKNITYIPNGVDLGNFNPKGGKLETRLKPPVVLAVGALNKQKRIDLVIKTVSKLKNTSLLVAGEGEQKYIALGKKLLGKRFQQLSVAHKEMPKVYRVAQVFTLVPEGTEAFGIVYVEAMATNLPVVAIDDEQRREIIGDAGLLIEDPENIDKFSKSLRKALSTDWGNKPRIQAKKFDWDDIARKYEQLFEQLIK